MFADRRDTLKSPLKVNAQPLILVELIFIIPTNTNRKLILMPNPGEGRDTAYLIFALLKLM